jgi:GTP-binding protein
MHILDAVFLMSNTKIEACPDPYLKEVAFIGRSNVGKSSLINMLVNKKGLAKTSSTPGKTQTINHFEVQVKNGRNWYLVDLPGYGYAKKSKSSRYDWQAMSRKYLHERENLVCTFVLIDVRHDTQKIDLEFMEKLLQDGIPMAIIFTKADKLKDQAAVRAFEAYEQKLIERWGDTPNLFLSSAESQLGKERLLSFIETLV